MLLLHPLEQAVRPIRGAPYSRDDRMGAWTFHLDVSAGVHNSVRQLINAGFVNNAVKTELREREGGITSLEVMLEIERGFHSG